MLERIAVTEVIDDGVDCVRSIFSPWVGVLWLGVVPVRLALVFYLVTLTSAPNAERHASYLRQLSWLVAGTFLLAVLARAVFTRACHVAQRVHGLPGREVLRLTRPELAAHVLVGLLGLAAMSASWFLVVTLPFIASGWALGAAVAHEQDRVSVTRPIAAATNAALATRAPLLLLIVFAIAWLLACTILVAGTQLVLWALGGVTGLDLTVAEGMLSITSPHYRWLVVAFGATIVEPFWLASHVAYVRRLRARESGEDLRAWLGRLIAAREQAA